MPAPGRLPMEPSSDRVPVVAAALDILAKAFLVLVVARVAVDPAWGNLEGKAPGTRVATYPLLALVVPSVYLLLHPGRTHLANTGFLCAAVLMLTSVDGAPLLRRIERSVAIGLGASVLWELWEYYAFVTRSIEGTTAYADTVGDLALGLVGSVVAAVLVRRRASRRTSAGSVNGTSDREPDMRKVR